MRFAVTVGVLIALTLSGCTEKGSSAMPFEPDSQQEIQNAVASFLSRTVAALPPGARIDASRFTAAGHNSPCDDTVSTPIASMRFHTIGELRMPAATYGADTVSTVGQTWRLWGWRVVERDDFGRPNRFGYSPNGYRLQIVTVGAGHPPVVQASSPCFARRIARDDIPFPEVIAAE